MTEQQQATIAELQAEQVAFPPMIELDDGAIRVVLVLSFGPGRRGFPSDIEFESVVVSKLGQITSRATVHYVPARPR